jgi:hypothetical protein
MHECFLLVTTAIWFHDRGHNKKITRVIAVPYPRHYKAVRFSLILRTGQPSFRMIKDEGDWSGENQSILSGSARELGARSDDEGQKTNHYPIEKAEEQMSILDVPGARLYYETYSSGPVMLMVPGASGSADNFQRVRQHLAAHYTVVTYDRRGFSRSQLDGPQDYDHRLSLDADDVRQLIERVSDEPAIVFGGSSGAIIALEVLARHPSLVRTLIVHEPPAVRLLADGQKWIDFFSVC